MYLNRVSQEYKFIGLNMEKVSILYGLFLIIWGVVVSLVSNSSSLTSYIPSVLGCLIFFFAILAINIPSKKKLLMHIVVTIGLVVFIGGLDLLRNFSNIFDSFWPDISKLIMMLSGLFFTYLCIKSFIHARKQRVE